MLSRAQKKSKCPTKTTNTFYSPYSIGYFLCVCVSAGLFIEKQKHSLFDRKLFSRAPRSLLLFYIFILCADCFV